MNSRIHFRWRATALQGAKAHLCHQTRCSAPAVTNRLCSQHLAWWTTQCSSQPPMPDYGTPHVTQERRLRAEAIEAETDLQRIADRPMRTPDDAAYMRKEVVAAKELVALVRAEKRESIRPLLSQLRSIKKAHDVTIARYSDCEKLAAERLREYGHDGYEERPVPMYSDVAPAPGKENVTQLRPGVRRRSAK